MRYDPAVVRAWYDGFGVDAEWERFNQAPGGRANLAVHLRFVADHVADGDEVLDIGAGPGRFSIAAIERGARVVVADLNEAMLEASRERIAAAGAEHGVIARTTADVTDLSAFDDGRFDVTMCFGGPISYAADRAADAVTELARVTRPGGTLLLSVMSTIGSFHTFWGGVMEELRELGPEHVERVFRTGELTAEHNRGHQLRMFRWTEIRDLVEAAGCEIVAASASNLAPRLGEADPYEGLDEAHRALLLDLEVRAAAEPGALDLGTHIVIAARTPHADR